MDLIPEELEQATQNNIGEKRSERSLDLLQRTWSCTSVAPMGTNRPLQDQNINGWVNRMENNRCFAFIEQTWMDTGCFVWPSTS